MTRVLQSVSDLRAWRKALGGEHITVGFVPTMGALHQGHAELLRQARSQCDFVVLSIFVNPTQFNDPKDLEKYPRTLEQDLKLAQLEKVDIVWTPSATDLYPDNYTLKVTESELSLPMEGVSRPGHFDGMLTVVLKLLNAVQADQAFFGEKDFQQLRLIQKMVHSFFIPTQIVSVPTVREQDGLAMSSRNLRLSDQDRAKAPIIFQTLKTAADANQAQQKLEALGLKVDYVHDWQNRRLVAAWLGPVRLIDNISLDPVPTTPGIPPQIQKEIQI